MRWLKFTADGRTSWGIVENDRVIAINGEPFGEWQRTPRTHSLADVKIELPLMPRTFYCVGLNYLKHLKEAADKTGTVPNVPDRPEIGYRAQNALIAHDEDVVIPASATENIHYEGELVVVIGKKAKHLTEANAIDCVFGYTIGNDVSERSWQKADRSLWRHTKASLRGMLQRLGDDSALGWKALAAASALALVIAALVPIPFRITAPSVVEGEVQRSIAAPFQGFIRDAKFRAGDVVHSGQVLATLDDRDLRLDLARWQSDGSTVGIAGPANLISFSDRGTEFAWGVGAGAHIGNVGARLEYESFSVANTNGARIISLDVILRL